MRIGRTTPRHVCGVILLMLGAVASPGWSQSSSAQTRDPAETLFVIAEEARASGRVEEAIGRYERVVAEYPTSPWAARAGLEAARSMVGQGRWAPAMRQMQEVYLAFPGTREAEQALERNTILHRVRLRQGQPVFRYARTAVNGQQALLKRVVAVDMDSTGRVYVGTRQSVAVFSESGSLVRTEPTEETRGLAVKADAPAVFGENTLRTSDGPVLPILIPVQNRPREADIQAGVMTPAGVILVADRRTKGIHRLSSTGSYLSLVAPIDAVRLAVGPRGEVAAIERETRAVHLVTAGGQARPIPMSGPGYMLRAPVDVAFDPLGQLYVLERDSVVIFSATGELLSVFTPGTAAGAFRMAVAFHVDAAGRLYVYDEDSERLQVFH